MITHIKRYENLVSAGNTVYRAPPIFAETESTGSFGNTLLAIWHMPLVVIDLPLLGRWGRGRTGAALL